MLGSQGGFSLREHARIYTRAWIPFNKVLIFIKTLGMVLLFAPGEPRGAPVADGIREERESWD